MASCFPSCRTLGGKTSALPERQQVQEAPAGNRQEPREQRVEGVKRSRVTADESRQHRNGGEDALPRDQLEPGLPGKADVLVGRPVPRVLLLGGGADQPSGDEEMHARLEVGEVGNGDQQLAVWREDAVQLSEGLTLVLEREVLEHVQAERPIE